ncbi:hypothetical protein F4780DRAFT_753041, partial [Xylariomycetidae sp. FL0641]
MLTAMSCYLEQESARQEQSVSQSAQHLPEGELSTSRSPRNIARAMRDRPRRISPSTRRPSDERVVLGLLLVSYLPTYLPTYLLDGRRRPSVSSGRTTLPCRTARRPQFRSVLCSLVEGRPLRRESVGCPLRFASGCRLVGISQAPSGAVVGAGACV